MVHFLTPANLPKNVTEKAEVCQFTHAVLSKLISEEQIQFLVNLQRLLDEGLFVASYKFARSANVRHQGALSTADNEIPQAEVLRRQDC